MESLRITDVVKTYGAVTALERVSLSVDKGEFLTILGPSGSGKTTLLKIVAGFEAPSAGKVELDGRDITHVRPAARGIGMVFQNYALFPHMTVAENVAFPLRMRKLAKDEVARRVGQSLDLVELAGYQDRLPAQLSGGQQQRVALARAITFDPPLLLLDEPFGALDRKLREQMQLQVKELQRRLGLTAVFVTHDQDEALLMSDRVVVMSEGRIHQVDTPETIYARPLDRFVADFVGESSIYEAVVAARDASGVTVRTASGFELRSDDCRFDVGESIHVVIRPESPEPDGSAADAAEGPDRLSLTVEEAIFSAGSRKYRLTGDKDFSLLLRWPSTISHRPLAVGERVALRIPPAAVRLVK